MTPGEKRAKGSVLSAQVRGYGLASVAHQRSTTGNCFRQLRRNRLHARVIGISWNLLFLTNSRGSHTHDTRYSQQYRQSVSIFARRRAIDIFDNIQVAFKTSRGIYYFTPYAKSIEFLSCIVLYCIFSAVFSTVLEARRRASVAVTIFFFVLRNATRKPTNG